METRLLLSLCIIGTALANLAGCSDAASPSREAPVLDAGEADSRSPAEGEDGDVTSDVESWDSGLSPSLEQVSAVIGAIDYLPFDYTGDGCYVRSAYMSMELVLSGIPSSAILATACYYDGKVVTDESQALKGPGGVPWRFHTTPIIVLDSEQWVIDPLFSAEPLKETDWLSFLGSPPVHITIASAAAPHHPSTEACGERAGKVAVTLEQMEPFLLENIMDGCAYAREMIQKMGDPEGAKEERLINRTRVLALAMRERALLSVMDADLLEQLEQEAWCPVREPK